MIYVNEKKIKNLVEKNRKLIKLNNDNINVILILKNNKEKNNNNIKYKNLINSNS